MKQGEIWDLGGGNKVLVVSSDVHNGNPQNLPVVVPIVRRRGGEPPAGAAIALRDADPVAGVILAALVTPADRPDGTPIGMVTGATMANVTDAILDLFSPH